MADAYTPPLSDFGFTADEAAALAAAEATANPWTFSPTDNNMKSAFKSAKTKIKSFHMQRHKELCCYCRTNLGGTGPYLSDREHVLPKSKDQYKPFIFAMWNIGVSCKRCNMEYKRKNVDFVVNRNDPAFFQLSENYLFVHPNFDYWLDHLNRKDVQVDDAIMVTLWSNKTAKGDFTYDYFKLGTLQRNTFDQAQGRSTPDAKTEAGAMLRALAEEFET